MAGYVRAMHQAYLDAVELLPKAEQGRMPLMTIDSFSVAAVGTSNLHIVATTEKFPAPTGVEVVVDDSVGDLAWELRFFDPVIIPSLGLLDESGGAKQEEVRRALGISTYLYHFTVPPGGGLSSHHALHAGTGLAHSHAAAERDFETMRIHARGREHLVDEMHGAFVAGLPVAQTLLAQAISPNDAAVAEAANAQPLDLTQLRRSLLQSVRGDGR